MREHRRLRGPGRSAGEDQDGEVGSLPLDNRDRLGVRQIVRGDPVLQGGNVGRVDARHRRLPGWSDDDGPDAHRGQLALQLPGRTQRVEGHGHQPRPQQREVRRHEGAVVATDDADSVAGLQPEVDQGAPQSPDLVPQCTVRRRVTPADQGHGVVGMRVDHGREVHEIPSLGLVKVVQPRADTSSVIDEQATPGKPGCAQSHGPTGIRSLWQPGCRIEGKRNAQARWTSSCPPTAALGSGVGDSADGRDARAGQPRTGQCGRQRGRGAVRRQDQRHPPVARPRVARGLRRAPRRRSGLDRSDGRQRGDLTQPESRRRGLSKLAQAR